MRYLKGTIDYSISYGTGKTESPRLQGYSNADYTGDIVDRRSTIGHLYLLNRGPVTWTSIKQCYVATSTTQLEYISLLEASKQGQ
jgi:hypothetical protein